MQEYHRSSEPVVNSTPSPGSFCLPPNVWDKVTDNHRQYQWFETVTNARFLIVIGR